MGVGWRRVTEKVRQTMNVGTDKGFLQTFNSRNEAMMNEAADFANHLKRCEKDIRALKQTTEGLLNTTKIVMSAPLPRVFELGEGGKAMAVVPPPGSAGVIGGDFKGDDLTKASKDIGKKLDSEVLLPMQRWTTAYQTVQARMKRLEGVRLEVDSRQRTVTALTTNLNKQRAGLPPNPTQSKSKGEVTVDLTIRKLTNKDNKLADGFGRFKLLDDRAATRQAFKEQEALVYQQLAQLIRDAVWLKSYLAAVLRLEQETFTLAYHALGPNKSVPVMHSPMDMAIPSAPGEGMIPAARPHDQAGAPMGRLNTKISLQKRPLGKENGILPLSPGKTFDRIPVGNPVNQMGVTRRQDTRAFDRYPVQDYTVIEHHDQAPAPMSAW